MANEKNHSPGPWKILDRHELWGVKKGDSPFGISNDQGSSICTIETYEKRTEIIANANLISAAPEMFDALQSVLEYCQTHGGLSELLEMCPIESAIAAGKGEIL